MTNHLGNLRALADELAAARNAADAVMTRLRAEVRASVPDHTETQIMEAARLTLRTVRSILNPEDSL